MNTKKEEKFQKELLHVVPHVNISSWKDLKKFSKEDIPYAVRTTRPLRLRTIERLSFLGVKVVKLPPKTFKKFSSYFRIVSGQLFNPKKNPIEIKTHYGTIYVVKTTPFKSEAKRGRPKEYKNKISQMIDLWSKGYSYRKIGELLDVPKSTVQRYIKRYKTEYNEKMRKVIKTNL